MQSSCEALSAGGSLLRAPLCFSERGRLCRQEGPAGSGQGTCRHTGACVLSGPHVSLRNAAQVLAPVPALGPTVETGSLQMCPSPEEVIRVDLIRDWCPSKEREQAMGPQGQRLEGHGHTPRVPGAPKGGGGGKGPPGIFRGIPALLHLDLGVLDSRA